MSNHLISLAYKRDLRTSMRKAVLVLMADKASDDGSGIWAAKQTMADELCCSKQTVIDTIKGFIAEGLVSECGQRKSPNGYTVEYSINISAVEALPLVNCHADRGSRTLTGQPAGPVKPADLTGQPSGPEPSLTPRSSEAKASSLKSDPWHSLPDGWIPTRPLSANTQSHVDEWPPGALESELESFRAWAANAQPVKGKGLKKDWTTHLEIGLGASTVTDTADINSNPVLNPMLSPVPVSSTPSMPQTKQSHDPRLTKIMLELGLRYRPLALADQATFEATLAILTRDLAGANPVHLAEAVKRWVRVSEFMPKAANLLSLMREMAPKASTSDTQALADYGNATCTRRDLQWVVVNGDLRLEPRA